MKRSPSLSIFLLCFVMISSAMLVFAGGVPAATDTIVTHDVSIIPQKADTEGYTPVNLGVAKTFQSFDAEIIYQPNGMKILDLSPLRTIIDSLFPVMVIDNNVGNAKYGAYGADDIVGVKDDTLLWIQFGFSNLATTSREAKYKALALFNINGKPYESTITISLNTMYGDISGDKTVSGLDAATVAQWVVGIQNKLTAYLDTRWGQQIAKVSANNGLPTSYDAALIMAKAVEKIPNFPVEAIGIHPAPSKQSENPGEFKVNSTRITPNQWEVVIESIAPDAVSGYAEFWVPSFLGITSIQQGKETLLASNRVGETLKICFAKTLAGNEKMIIKVNSDIVTTDLPFVLTTAQTDEKTAKIPEQTPTLNEWKEMIRSFDFGKMPQKSELLQNYPNPFNPETWVPFQIKEATNVKMEIYNYSGNKVREINLGFRFPGVYSSRSQAAYWDGKNEAGEKVTSGIYFYTIKAGNFTATKKMVVVK